MWDTICLPWAQRRKVQAKGLEHIFSKLSAGDFQNPGKEIDYVGRRHPNRRPEEPASLGYICKHSEHTKHTVNRKRVKATKGRLQGIHKDKSIRLTGTLKVQKTQTSLSQKSER